MSVTVTPTRRLVLVKALPSPQRSSVLYTPESPEIAIRAEVVALGPECKFLQRGQTVLINALVGHEMPDQQKLIQEVDVLAFT